MAKHKSKPELLKDIHTEHARLEKVLGALTHRDMTCPGIVGHWSVKDVLAHLTAWERLFLRWYDAGKMGRQIEPEPVGMSRNAMDALNEKIFKQNRRRSLAAILAEFQDSYQVILAAVQAMTEEEMFAKGCYLWTGRLTLADYIAGNTCSHYHWAATQIRLGLRHKAFSMENQFS